MKLTSTALLVLAFSSATMAQTPAPSKAGPTLQVTTKRDSALTSSRAVSAPTAGTSVSAASAAETNPFTGKALTVEQIQLKLEEAKLQTQTLEEMLKQSNIAEELKNVPLRKAVEAAQAHTNLKKEETAQAVLVEQAKAAADATAAAKAASRPAATAPARKPSRVREAEQAAAQPAEAPRAPRPTLLSVMDVGGAKSVVMDFGGATLVAADGDMTPAGPVRVIDGNSASVGGEVFKIRGNTLSRFVVSDPKVDPRATTAGASAYVAPTSAGFPAGAAGLPPLPTSVAAAAPGGQPVLTPTRSALPALQLPPGITSFPASR